MVGLEEALQKPRTEALRAACSQLSDSVMSRHVAHRTTRSPSSSTLCSIPTMLPSLLLIVA